jgi:hypothetical protein
MRPGRTTSERNKKQRVVRGVTCWLTVPSVAAGRAGLTYSVGMSGSSLGVEREELLLQWRVADDTKQLVTSESGPGWLAHITSKDLPESMVWQILRKSFIRKMLTVAKGPQGTFDRIRFLDPGTGNLTHEVPVWLPHGCVIGPNGRRVACIVPVAHELQIWNSDPAPCPRWLIAILAGIATTAGAILVSRAKRALGVQTAG